MFGAGATPELICVTGIGVWVARLSIIIDGRPRTACRTITNASPVSRGIAAKSSVSASTPPADTPIPTIVVVMHLPFSTLYDAPALFVM